MPLTRECRVEILKTAQIRMAQQRSRNEEGRATNIDLKIYLLFKKFFEAGF